jgi:hypothetical protein
LWASSPHEPGGESRKLVSRRGAAQAHRDGWRTNDDRAGDWFDEDDLDFRSARVAGHGKTRREPLDQARPLRERYAEIGHFFTGPIRAPLRTYIVP